MRASLNPSYMHSATSAFIVMFTIHPFVKPPQLWYYPVEHAWTFTDHASGIVIGWYGRTLMAAFVGLAVALAMQACGIGCSVRTAHIARWLAATTTIVSVTIILLLDFNLVRH